MWFPPVRFREPLVIDGLALRYMTGSFVDYGNTFANLVVGALLGDAHASVAFSGATAMDEFAKAWYKPTKGGAGHGERTLHGDMAFVIGLAGCRYTLSIRVRRGAPLGLWSHTFLFQNDTFDLHEALTLWDVELRRSGSNVVLQRTSATGLLEFGANLVGIDNAY